MSLNGEKEDMKNATSIVDAFAGMKLAFAISGALYGRERTRRGCHIIVSMKGSAFDLLEQNLIASSLTRQNPAKVGNMDSAIAPFGVFRTKDAAIVLAIGSDRQWEVFLQLFKADRVRLGRDAFSTNDVRVKNFRTLQREIERIFRRYSSTKLLRMLTKAAIPCGKVNSMRDVLRDAENYDQELLEIIDHPDIGRFVVPAGGVFFSRYEREKYRPAPQARHTKNYGI
jgi:crotonobetainyl-CoA:carnitine CoA-transferase CaiB-like acyl-CoA transferase